MFSTFAEYMIHQIIDLIKLPSGIIYFEEQLIQATIAFAHAWILQEGAPLIIIGLAVYFILVWVLLGRIPHFHVGRGVSRIARTVRHMLINILLAWAMLIYGALRGERRSQSTDEDENAGRRGEDNATFSRRITPSYVLRHVSLHFRLGRLIYRGFYWLLGFIPFFHRNENTERAHEYISRILAILVIFWGVWQIPADFGLV